MYLQCEPLSDLSKAIMTTSTYSASVHSGEKEAATYEVYKHRVYEVCE